MEGEKPSKFGTRTILYLRYFSPFFSSMLCRDSWAVAVLLDRLSYFGVLKAIL